MTSTEHSISWSLASSLSERRAGAAAIADVDRARSERRARDWRVGGFDAVDARFHARLAAEQLDEPTLHALLGESANSLAQRTAARAWVRELDEAFAGPSPTRSLPIHEAVQAHALAPFLQPLRPLILRSHDRLHARARELAARHPLAPFDPDDVVAVLWPAGAEQVLRRIGRTFVLELAIARMSGTLAGDTPEDRFASFVRQLCEPARMRALLDEYPVLGRQLVLALERWVATGEALLEQLCADAAELRERFAGGRPLGKLVRASSGGDLHRGGQAVRVLAFEGGLRLVHKPRSLAVDRHFNALLEWLSARTELSFRTLEILDRGDHGWVEHVEAEPCADLDAVRRFHVRLGGLLALLGQLAATDMHHENLIAAGEQPVLIDLEGLFHPDPWTIDLRDGDRPVHHATLDTVLAVGLLPWRVWADEARAGLDIGGLAQMAGQRTPFAAPVWRAAGTDLMHLEREHQVLAADRNRPTLGDQPIHAHDYVEELVRGFDLVYRTMLAHRDELLAARGLLAAFEGDETRVILRSTMSYANLLHESFHPDLLRDALERDRVWNELWALAEHRPSVAALVAHERADLHRGDIPLFSSTPGTGLVCNSLGEPVKGFPRLESGLARARRCIERMSDEDQAWQRWLIHASMATESPAPKALTSRHPRLGDERAEPRALIDAASRIGDRLATLAIPGTDGSATWIALAIRTGGRAVIEQQNLDLYDGLPGTALFLARLGAITGEAHHRSLAAAAVATIRSQLERPIFHPRALGALVGWGGLIYAWTQLGKLWSDARFFDEAAGMLERLPPLLEHDIEHDVSGGAAGCILALLGLAEAGVGQALEFARTCGDRLLATAQRSDAGLGWVQPGIGEQSLTGFAHGNAGRALALARLATATKLERHRSAAVDALSLERSQFVPALGNWPDLRTAALAHHRSGEPLPCRCSWCHGAPGIGIARLAMLAHHDDERMRGEIASAVTTTLAQGFGDNHSACHGDLGNVELLLLAGEVLAEPELRTQAQRHAAAILRDLASSGVRCGVPRHIETPGFFTGLAGIGHQLLRLAAPADVPSVLAFAG